MMAEIGKRTGVAILFGRIRLHGFLARWLWRTYYLANLPTSKKKLKVMGDWTSDLFFKPDVAMIKRSDIQSIGNIDKQSSSNSSSGHGNIKNTKSQ